MVDSEPIAESRRARDRLAEGLEAEEDLAKTSVGQAASSLGFSASDAPVGDPDEDPAVEEGSQSGPGSNDGVGGPEDPADDDAASKEAVGVGPATVYGGQASEPPGRGAAAPTTPESALLTREDTGAGSAEGGLVGDQEEEAADSKTDSQGLASDPGAPDVDRASPASPSPGAAKGPEAKAVSAEGGLLPTPAAVPEPEAAPDPEIKEAEVSADAAGGGASKSEGLQPVGAVVMPSPTPPEQPLFAELYAEAEGGTPAELTAHAQSGLDQVTAVAEADKTEVLGRGATLSAELAAAVTERISTIEGAFASSIATVQAHFEGLRGKVEAGVGQALAALDGQLAATVGRIDASLKTQQQQVAAGFDAAVEGMDTVVADGTTEIQSAWTDEVAALRSAGKDRADAAMEQARALARGWTGGEGIEKERNDARRKAALEVGKKAAEQIAAKANQAADSMAPGVEMLPDAVALAFAPNAEALAQARADTLQTLDEAAESARSQAHEAAQKAKRRLHSQKTSALNGLTDLEGEVVGSLEETRDHAVAAFSEAGDNLQAEAAAAAATLASTYGYLLAQVQAGLDPESIPRTEHTAAAVQEALVLLAGFKAEQTAALDEFRVGALAQLDASTAGALEAASAAEAKALETSSAAVAEQLAEVEANTKSQTAALAELGTKTDKALEELAQRSIAAAEEGVEAAAQQVGGVQEACLADLCASRDNALAEMDKALGGVRSKASKAAREAAAQIKEKSLLDRALNFLAKAAAVVASIVVAVVIFVAVAALVIATFGVGLAALVAAGAIAGFAAGIVSSLAKDGILVATGMQDEMKSWGAYLQDGISGAVSGVFFMVGGSFVGAAIGEVVVGSLTDQVTDILLLDQSWNTAEFVGSLALGGLLMGAGKLVPDAWGQRLVDKIFPPVGRGGNWNAFQQAMPDWVNKLPKDRLGKIWTDVILGTTLALPGDVVKKFVEETTKDLAGSGVRLENDVFWVSGVAFDDPDSAEQEARRLRKKQQEAIDAVDPGASGSGLDAAPLP